jgi:hypothetical protein
LEFTNPFEAFSPINAKLGTVEATWDVERGVDRVAFQAAFYETS